MCRPALSNYSPLTAETAVYQVPGVSAMLAQSLRNSLRLLSLWSGLVLASTFAITGSSSFLSFVILGFEFGEVSFFGVAVFLGVAAFFGVFPGESFLCCSSCLALCLFVWLDWIRLDYHVYNLLFFMIEFKVA